MTNSQDRRGHNAVKGKQGFQTVERAESGKSLGDLRPLQPEPESTMAVDGYGNRVWRNSDGLRYRTDGPAFEDSTGTKMYYINDKLHRTDGPAIESVHGCDEYYVNDKRHRTDGPAIEWPDGTKAYFLNGKEFDTEEEWREAVESL